MAQGAPLDRANPGQSGSRFAIALIFSLFFFWGLANALNDVLVPKLKKLFTLSDLESSLVQSVFYFGYFVWAIPAAMVMRRFGYKAGVLIGLVVFACGALMFVPASYLQQYWVFLASLFVLATGLAFLETSANPLVATLGSPQGAEQRLNFAQSFNAFGAISGALVGQHFILSGAQPAGLDDPAAQAAFMQAEAAGVRGPYLVFGIVVLAFALLAALARFPSPQQGAQGGKEAEGSILSVLAKPTVMAAVGAQFLYVGAQVGIWSFIIRYGQYTAGLDERHAAGYLTATLVAFMVGRFAATALMSVLRPVHLLAAYAGINIGLCLLAASMPGQIGLYCLTATSFFMSLMFPTIFAIGVRQAGAGAKSASSLLVMAIIGGAVMAALVGYVSDHSAIHIAMLVPAAAFVGILAFALVAMGWKQMAAEEAETAT